MSGCGSAPSAGFLQWQAEVRRARNSPFPLGSALEAGWDTPGHLSWEQTPVATQQGPASRSHQGQPLAGAAATV